MGLFALPNILVFQMFLPLVSPFIDVMFLAGVINFLVDRTTTLKPPQPPALKSSSSISSAS
ncbi:MAG: hypothetical protein WDM87_06450 [Terracidiphilus sp.]